MSKGYKGGDFEREICKLLSRWWSKGLMGQERDDIFWRSSQSGGRATQRSKRGVSTYGSYGDIAAVDPIGEPLLKLFTIELKRGDSHGTPGDLFDTASTDAQRPFEAALIQAERCHKEAGSIGWMLIHRRDRRIPITYVDLNTARLVCEFSAWRRPNVIRYDMRVNTKGSGTRRLKFVALSLESFLARVSPAQIIEVVKQYGKT